MTIMEQSTMSEAACYVFGFGMVLLAIICFAIYLLKTWHNQNFRRIPKKRIDAAYSNGQFYTPPSIIGGKGLR